MNGISKKKQGPYEKNILSRWRLILGKRSEDEGFNFGDGNSKQDRKTKLGQSKEDSINKENRSKGSGRSKNGSDSRNTNSKNINNDSRSISHPQDNIPIHSKNKLIEMDNTLNMVYNPQNQKRSAGLNGSSLSIPKWIENVNKFFPSESKEVLEKDLISKSNISEIFKHPELFEKIEPNIEMVKTILNLKNMMPEKVKVVARKIVQKVVEDLKEKIKNEVEKKIIGAIKRDTHTPIKVFRNIDWKQSIQKNLKHYDPILKKLIMAEPRFYNAEKKKKPWQIIVLVDESGSMTDSVIYSVVMASIFSSLPSVKTNLVIFDTEVVDLSDKIDDPVDILMSVQLSGGTDITKAVRYSRSLIKKPKKAIMVIISDFYEGRSEYDLTKEIKNVLEGETKIVGIAALGSDARPFYNIIYARKLNSLGIDVIACTPEKLADIIGKLIEK